MFLFQISYLMTSFFLSISKYVILKNILLSSRLLSLECLVHPHTILFIKLSTMYYVLILFFCSVYLYILYIKHFDRSKLLIKLTLLNLNNKIFIEKLRLFSSFLVSRHWETPCNSRAYDVSEDIETTVGIGQV